MSVPSQVYWTGIAAPEAIAVLVIVKEVVGPVVSSSPFPPPHPDIPNRTKSPILMNTINFVLIEAISPSGRS
jgi:hypothetical protein